MSRVHESGPQVKPGVIMFAETLTNFDREKRKRKFFFTLILFQMSLFSRPWRSQGLLFKQPCDSFSQSKSQPFPPTAFRRRHAQMVGDSTSSYKIDYVISRTF